MASSSVETVYTANLGFTTISTANSNLNGSGTLGTVITGAGSGTFIKTIIIKAQTDTSQGMVRIFTKKSGGNDLLLSEIWIPPIIKSGRDLSYGIVLPINYLLASGEILKVSTENADTFNVIAEAFDISYLTNTNFIGSSLEFVANAGAGIIDAANPNLDGTGSMSQIITASSAAGFKGCAITSLIIKAQQTTSPGMVRLFVQDNGGSTPILFSETIIPSVVQSSTTQAFSCQVISGSLCLPAGYSIWASTEHTNTFSVIAEGLDWKNV